MQLTTGEAGMAYRLADVKITKQAESGSKDTSADGITALSAPSFWPYMYQVYGAVKRAGAHGITRVSGVWYSSHGHNAGT